MKKNICEIFLAAVIIFIGVFFFTKVFRHPMLPIRVNISEDSSETIQDNVQLDNSKQSEDSNSSSSLNTTKASDSQETTKNSRVSGDVGMAKNEGITKHRGMQSRGGIAGSVVHIISILDKEGFTKALSLTNKQKNQIRSIIVKDSEHNAKLRQNASSANENFSYALYAKNYNAASSKKCAHEAAIAQNKLAYANLEKWKQVRAVLTSAQVKELKEISSKPREHGFPRGKQNKE